MQTPHTVAAEVVYGELILKVRCPYGDEYHRPCGIYVEECLGNSCEHLSDEERNDSFYSDITACPPAEGCGVRHWLEEAGVDGVEFRPHDAKLPAEVTVHWDEHPVLTVL